ncbi:hypothetical protein JCM9957A_19540 [Kineosporia succinea]
MFSPSAIQRSDPVVGIATPIRPAETDTDDPASPSLLPQPASTTAPAHTTETHARALRDKVVPFNQPGSPWNRFD